MSLVGPRPLLMRYLPYFTKKECLRFNAKPGITGWAQINGRNNLEWTERLALDIWYVENLSILLDIKIILMTLGKVLKSEGLNIDPGCNMKDLDVERRKEKNIPLSSFFLLSSSFSYKTTDATFDGLLSPAVLEAVTRYFICTPWGWSVSSAIS